MKESSHYYCPKTGEARHTIIGNNKVERATTLRDARKHGWYPSVSTVLKVLAKPELDAWKQMQVLLASLTLSRLPGEDDDTYCARIIADAFKQVGDAADLGTRVHAAIENHFQGRPFEQSLAPYVESVDKWVKDSEVHFLRHEERLIHSSGYGGTTDAIIITNGWEGYGVFDAKTRKSKRGYLMKPWATEPMQIAAYGEAANEKAAFGVNLFISTTEPGRVEAEWYSAERLQKEYRAFQNAFSLWKHLNNYFPGTSE